MGDETFEVSINQTVYDWDFVDDTTEQPSLEGWDGCSNADAVTLEADMMVLNGAINGSDQLAILGGYGTEGSVFEHVCSAVNLSPAYTASGEPINIQVNIPSYDLMVDWELGVVLLDDADQYLSYSPLFEGLNGAMIDVPAGTTIDQVRLVIRYEYGSGDDTIGIDELLDYISLTGNTYQINVDQVQIIEAIPTLVNCFELQVNQEDYRYGFNGKEKDDELKGSGNSYDFGARMYDSRTGRWLSVDPLASKYQDISPYAFVANSPVQFIDPDGKVIVDPATGEQVVKLNGQWQTASGGEVSKDFIKNSQPVLDKLTASDIGTKIYDELQAIRTIVVIDLSDKENVRALKKGGNSRLRTGDSQWTTGDDGLYNDVVITPDMEKMETQANADGIDFEEKLIQTMSVEKDHIATKEQIEKESSYDYNLFASPSVVEDAYGPLVQKAVEAGKAYRDEKQQEIDDSSDLPIKRINGIHGSNISVPKEK